MGATELVTGRATMEMTMRRLRWLLPVAIVFIVAAVGSIYLKQRDKLALEAPPRPERLASGVQGAALNWCYGQSEGERTHVEICAAKITEVDGARQLEGVQLKLYHTDGKEFDLVTSDSAQFDEAAKSLYSDGAVLITLGVPVDQEPSGRLLHITTSGVRFSSETGAAETTRPLTFEFDRGSGSAVGGRYDPTTQELRLINQVSLDWKGQPGSKPVHIEAGQAWYYERESKVHLEPWTKLTREALSMDGGVTDVFLDKGDIRDADVQAARGVQKQPNRQVEFGADDLHLHFGDDMLIRTINASKNASLVSTVTASRTTIRGDRLDMEFTPVEDESQLQSAVARGNSMVQAEPIARPGVTDLADKRTLRSDVIHLNMRAGGEEIEHVETDGKASLDLVPSRPAQPKRNVTGDRMWIDYGAKNKIDKFRTVNAHTRTERPDHPLMETDSKDLLAFFDPVTSALTRLEQTTDFTYVEGDRHASATRATLDQPKDTITLTGNARSSDATGSLTSDTLILNQKTGDAIAEGNVSSSRHPDRKGKSSAMLSNDAPMQATAARMTSSNKGQQIRYQGSAKAWQGANRVEADRIDLDNQRGIMEAHGKVKTEVYDKKKPANSSGLTIVHAPDLVYNRDTRVAHYTGGVNLERPGNSSLIVDSHDLEVFLSASDSDSSLEKAVADGAVRIVSTSPIPGSKSKRTKTATSEHADYDATEQRVILTGGKPLLVDSVKGNTQGEKLTWWVNNDKLEVVGEVNQPVKSRIKSIKK